VQAVENNEADKLTTDDALASMTTALLGGIVCPGAAVMQAPIRSGAALRNCSVILSHALAVQLGRLDVARPGAAGGLTSKLAAIGRRTN